MTTCDKLLKNVAEGRKNEAVPDDYLKIFLLSVATLGIYLIITVYRRSVLLKKYVQRKRDFFILYKYYLIEKVDYNDENKIDWKIKKFYNKNSKFLFKYFILAYIFLVLTVLFIAYIYVVNGLTFKDYNMRLPFIPDFFYGYKLIFPFNIMVDLAVMFFFLFLFNLFVYIIKTVSLWNSIQELEKDIFDILNKEAFSAGIISRSESYNLSDKLKINKGNILLYGIITLGIWLLYLDYKVYSGVKEVIETSHNVENILVSGISVEENI